MNMMPITEATETALRDAMAREVAPAIIVGIDAKPYVNQYDEEVLWIEVMLDNDNPKVPGGKLMSASLEAQKALVANHDLRFPVIDYRSASDVDEPAG